MDIGDNITFTDEECKAIQYHPADEFQREWSPESALELWRLISERILDKQSLIDEFQEKRQLGQYAAGVFEIRAQIALLETVQDQLLEHSFGSY